MTSDDDNEPQRLLDAGKVGELSKINLKKLKNHLWHLCNICYGHLLLLPLKYYETVFESEMNTK